MEHLHHFGLSEDPFRNEPRTRDYFETPASRAALARLERALRQHKGLMLVTGDVGSGKTMVLRRLFEGLEEEVFEACMLVVLNVAADAGWMLMRFARLLGVEEPATEREALLAQVYEQLAIVREEGRHTVLMIDDAHALASRSTLSDVCGLLKLEYEDRRLLSLVLAGGPHLEGAVRDDGTLAHRVEVRAHLEPLESSAAQAYLARRIEQVGGDPAILEDDAVESLRQLGGGLPGRMNTLADNALFEAFLCGRDRITRTDVARAARDLGWDGEAPAEAPTPESSPEAMMPTREAPMPPDPEPAPELAEPTVLVTQDDGIAESLDVLAAEEGDLGDLDSDLEAVFANAAGGPVLRTGPPKDEDVEEELVIELLEE